MNFVAAAALVVAGLLVLAGKPMAHRSLAAARLAAVVAPVRVNPAPAAVANRRRWWPATAAALAGVASWALVGQWWGILLGGAVAYAIHRGVAKLEPAAVRADRAQADAWLPLVADLLAAALRAGATTDRALKVVAEAVGGPLGDRLGAVGAALAMGAPPEEAWQPLHDLPNAAALARAGIRSAESGAALADTAASVADRLRGEADAAAEAAARRSGVLIVLPLGLCFLPAFVLLGVVPVVGSVLAGVLR
ncbi:hypothetical protein GCM10009765_05020 [Fodinicola feengrottensis]|uniref:Type II secretion system protein GspF domain-containing protein n=1 Tax=Fodinicola feengrottensis TaxID=435914 RepID=A0ABP4RP16_9ACTN